MQLRLVNILLLCSAIVNAVPVSEVTKVTTLSTRHPEPIEDITDASYISDKEVNRQINVYLNEVDDSKLTDAADGGWNSILSNGKVSSDGNWVAQHRTVSTTDYEAQVVAYRTQANVTKGTAFGRMTLPAHYKRETNVDEPSCADAIYWLKQNFASK